MAGDEWIQLDDFAMAVEEVDCELTRDVGWYGRDVHVLRLLAHHVHGGRSTSSRADI